MMVRQLKSISNVCAMLLTISCTNNIQQISVSEFTNSNEKVDFALAENEPLVITSSETITVDIARPTNKTNPAIVLVLHGNHSKKEAHRNHILELAKNCFIGIALQFKNSGQWYQKGRLLARAIPKLKS